MFIINVILDVPLRQSYSYIHSNMLSRGTRVTVDFCGRQQIGFVISSQSSKDFTDYPLDKLKPLLDISSEKFSVPNEIWQLCEFTASYYHHPLGNTIFCAIPTLLRKIGNLDYEILTQNYYQPAEAQIKPKGKFQLSLWEEIQKNPLNSKQIQTILGKNPQKLIQKWLDQGIIKVSPPPLPEFACRPLTLNSEQQQIVDSLNKGLDKFQVGIIYGITGSGKTEVFLHLIAKVLAQKKQILVLIPEINLTPQLSQRFQNRFPYAIISIVNSEVSNKERLNAWIAAKSAQSNVILGTRLNVFTPCANLGLIIVDEEHDNSFKQNDNLRYHARDLAIWRAKQADIPIILSSATPSLETLYNYKQGKYQLYKLTARANSNAQLPKIQLINLQHYPVNHAGISLAALNQLKKCLLRKEIALIFINRRGYAPIITCYDCGWISVCRYCTSRMVYHHDKKQLQCHHCGYHTPVPHSCPKCHNQYLHTIGHGTQKLEQFLQEEFPQARIKRVDRDTTNSKKAWHNLYAQVNADEVDILVGTQMLAKGHDFANLTLVIGLNLDNALYSYDFRASEDMFNTLTQVGGRAGRANKSGLVLLQTHYPAHPVYNFLLKHDFNGFVNYILQERSQNKLPPFSHYALIRLSHNLEYKLKQALKILRKISKEIAHEGLNIFPPVEAVIPKLHNKYRGQMLITGQNRSLLHSYLNQLEPRLKELQVVAAIDVDPFEL